MTELSESQQAGTGTPAVAQLSGPDAFHILQDSASQPMQTLKVAILDVSARGGAIPIDEVRTWVGAMVQTIPALRWRLHRMPLGLARPFWVDEGTIDVDHHVRLHRLDAATGSFDAFLSELCGDRLERDVPLWRLWVVEGLDAGRVAFVLQLHHALADGGASVQLWKALAEEVPPSAPGSAPLPAVKRSEIVLLGARSQWRQFKRIPDQWRRFRAYLAAAKQATGDDEVTQAFVGPMTRFNHPPHADRTCAFATLPFGELRDLAASLGGTLNDLYLTLCSGALRRYLAGHGELPSEGLTTICPSGVERDPGAFGNAVTSWYVALHTEIEDPAERMKAIRRSVSATRRATERDPNLLPDFQDYALANQAIVWLMRGIERMRHRPAFNVIVSNVRGPGPMELMGSPVVALQSLGPPSGRMGINITGWTYGDEFSIGLHTTRRSVPDVQRLAACFAEELDAVRKTDPKGHQARPD